MAARLAQSGPQGKPSGQIKPDPGRNLFDQQHEFGHLPRTGNRIGNLP
jgi:hypothetical protein